MKSLVVVLAVLLSTSSVFASSNANPFAATWLNPTPTPRPGPETLAEVDVDLSQVRSSPLSFKSVAVIDNGIVQITRVLKTGNTFRTKLTELSKEQIAHIRYLSEISDELDEDTKPTGYLQCSEKVVMTYRADFVTGHLPGGRYVEHKLNKIATAESCGGKSVSKSHAGDIELINILNSFLQLPAAK